MTIEAALISAISAVVAALCFLFQKLWARSEACEKWRNEKEPLITQMAERLGILSGVARMVNNCDVDGCPHAGKLTGETFSIRKPQPAAKP